MWLLIIISMMVALFFCCEKQGYHYDEYYSYYSTNISSGSWIPDGGYRSGDSIAEEFMALEGEGLNLSVVKTSQSFDVHPPLYYYLLRIVCWFSKGIFSKWQGLVINLIFTLASLILVWKIGDILGDKNLYISGGSVILTGLSAAFISVITMVRMYSMLTFECLLLTWLLVKAVKNGKYDLKSLYIPSFFLAFAGFMTHYYFAIYLFFATACMCIYLFAHKELRLKAFIYGGCTCLGLLAAVLYYPYCYSHIFKGYRGNDATSAFFDLGNTAQRLSFYLGLINDYDFGGAFYVLILMLLLLFLYCRFKRLKIFAAVKAEFVMLLITLGGYFALVSKTATALSEPAEAIRYQAPVYPLFILLALYCLVSLCKTIFKKNTVVSACLAVLLAAQIYGLCSDRVFFLYREDEADYAFSEERSSEVVACIYNPVNKWMVWDNSKELMNYENIYFVSLENENGLANEDWESADRIYVYTCRSDEATGMIEDLVDKLPDISGYELCEERLYMDIYVLE